MFTNLANELGHHLVSVLSGNMWAKGGHKFCVCVCVSLANKENIKFDQLDV